MVPTRIFSYAIPAMLMGASKRSSISLVKPNSTTSGRATACMPDSVMLNASMPGNSMLA
jgi:hypothetical protein